MLIKFVMEFILLQLPIIAIGEDCPCLPEKGNRTLPYPLNVRGDASTTKSEFLCDFIWTDGAWEHLKDKLLDRMTHRQKIFVRFTVPVLGFNNPYLLMSNYLTWVWVIDAHEYLISTQLYCDISQNNGNHYARLGNQL